MQKRFGGEGEILRIEWSGRHLSDGNAIEHQRPGERARIPIRTDHMGPITAAPLERGDGPADSLGRPGVQAVQGVPATTASPGLACSTTPASACTAAPGTARPAPRRQAATPTACASRLVSTPDDAARTTSTCGATGSRASGVAALCGDHRPPGIHRPAVGQVGGGSASADRRQPASPAPARGEFDDVGRAAAGEHLRDSATSTALPAVSPSGVDMSVSRPWSVPPAAVPSETIVSASRRASSDDKERAGTGFTSSTGAPGSLGDLLAHDRTGEQRYRFDGPGDITQRGTSCDRPARGRHPPRRSRRRPTPAANASAPS